MTYCLGWKSKTAAFLIADSAVTSITDDKENIGLLETTTFNELQGSIEDKKYVYEKAFKLYSIDNVAITFAGDTDIGNEIIDLIKEHLNFGRSIQQAINSSIENYPDFLSYPVIQILVACYEDEPKIYSIDNKKLPFITVVNEPIISFGSPPEHLREYTYSFYEAFKKSREEENYSELADEMMLLRMIALLQSYGIHNYTIEKGIGGAYSGLYITKEKIHWQPDVYYLKHGDDPAFERNGFTSVHIRNNHKFIITDKFNMVLSNLTKEKKLESDIDNINRLFEKDVINSFDRGVFKYIIFINTNRYVTTIVHMNYQFHHDYLCVDLQDNREGTVGLIISNHLCDIINGSHIPIESPNYTNINYIPYIPIENNYLDSINNILPELRISKTFGYDITSYKCLIYEGDRVKEWYYINFEGIFAFLKHHGHEKTINIVNCASDLLELEYRDGVITFPLIDSHELSDIFSKIPDKKTDKNIYLFDVLTNDETGVSSIQFTIQILTNNWTSAKKEAERQARTELGDLFLLTPIGIQFYHPTFR
ncbi:MAG: hypothetical protein ACXWTS_11200 [Methylococcaceae bacterium]